MTQRGFPFDAGEGLAYELDWSLMARHWMSDGLIQGVTQELAVFADSTGMQVKIPAGDAWLRGHYYRNDAQVTTAIAASNATNPRIDRVVLRIDYAANTIRIAVLTGVAAPTPVAPAVTQNDAIYELGIATVLVDAAVGTIAAGKVTDTRTYSGSWQDVEYKDLWVSGAGLLTNSAGRIRQTRTGTVTSDHQLIPGAQGVSNQYGLYNWAAARYEWYTSSGGIFVAPQGVTASGPSAIAGAMGTTIPLQIQNTSGGNSVSGLHILDAAGGIRSIIRIYNSTYSGNNNFGATAASTSEYVAQLPLYIGTNVASSVFIGANSIVRLTITSAGVSTFSGLAAINVPDGNGALSITATTNTNAAAVAFTNSPSGGGGQIGVDNFAGGTFGSTAAYAMTVYAGTGRNIELIPNATAASRVSIATTGAMTIRNGITSTLGGISNVVATTGTAAYVQSITGEGFGRLYIVGNGTLNWGPGTNTQDTNLYRNGIGVLKTDTQFEAGGDIVARRTLAAQAAIGAWGPAAQAGITFGNAFDATIYRFSAGTLATPGGMSFGANVSIAGTLAVGANGTQLAGTAITTGGLSVVGGVSISTGGLSVTTGAFTYTNNQNANTTIVVTNTNAGIVGSGTYSAINLISDNNSVLVAALSSNYPAPFAGKAVIQSNSAAALMFQNSGGGQIQFYTGSGGSTLAARFNNDGSFALGAAPATTSGAIRLTNNTGITCMNAAGTADAFVISYSNSDLILIGQAANNHGVAIAATSGFTIDMQTAGLSRMTVGIGVVVGAPTGGDKGAGSINAQTVWRNGTSLDYVFENAYRTTMLSISQMREFYEKEKHLPTIYSRDIAEEGSINEGGLTDRLWETVEVQAIYIGELEKRVSLLETIKT